MSIGIFFRNFRNFLMGNLVSLAGLSVGMMVAVFSVTYIVFESSYDRFHSKSDRIELVSTMMEIEPGNIVTMSGTHHSMKEYVDSHVPQVTMACRLRNIHEPLIIGQEKYKGHKGLYVDPEFFSIFDFRVKSGDASLLEEPGSIMLCQRLAQKIFGSLDCIGKTLFIKDAIYTVRGILEEHPRNSSIEFEYLIPMKDYINTLSNYSFVSVETYILTPVAYGDLSVVADAMNGFYDAYDIKSKDQYKVSLSPLTGQNQYHNNTSRNFKLFISVSVLVLLVSIVNFINSIAAGSELRTRETGIRKVMGAARVQLIRNMVVSSMLLSFIAGIIGLILSELFLEIFRELSGVELTQYGPGLIWIQVALIFISLGCGFLAGVFPAFRYTSSDILSLITGRDQHGSGLVNIRRMLVIIQYIISSGLLITLFVLYFQLRYLSHKNPGYISENRMLVEVPASLEFKYSSYISELEKIPGIESVSGNGSEFGGTVGFGLRLIGEEEGIPAMGYFVEDGFFRSYGIKLLDGLSFEQTSGRDSANVIIDRSTAAILGFDNPVGKKILLSRREVEIIALAEDADLITLKDERQPFFYTQFFDLCSELIIHYSGDPSVIARAVNEKLKEFEPESEYNFRTLDEARKTLYKKETNQVKIVLYVGIIALLVTLVGAYSMASYLSRRRARQSSIRKVMGASVSEVLQLSLREMFWMIVIAFTIASPLAYLVSNKWLQSFTQKINIGPLPFILAFVLLSLLILITVFFKERQAAMVNPVENLRQE